MNAGNLVQVNGKKEKPANGKVVAKKKDDEEDSKWLKKTIQIYYGLAGINYEVVGKCNTVQLQDSKDCTLEVDTVVSGIEVTNCKNVTIKPKADKEFWTVNANKSSGVVIVLTDTILKGGQEHIQSKGEGTTAKDFNFIGAAIDDIKFQKGNKLLALPSKFQFNLDTSGGEPKWNQTEFTGKIEKISKGVELVQDGESFITKGDKKGKTIFVTKKQGKKTAIPLDVAGACNMVVVDNCKKVELSVDSVLKGIIVQNSKQVKISVREGGKVPKVTVVNSHGCYVTLKDLPADFSLVANQWSDVNVNFPFADSTSELAIAEQFVYKLEGDKVTWSKPSF